MLRALSAAVAIATMTPAITRMDGTAPKLWSRNPAASWPSERRGSPGDDESRTLHAGEQAVGHERVAVAGERDVEHRAEDARYAEQRAEPEGASDHSENERRRGPDPQRADHHHLGRDLPPRPRRHDGSYERPGSRER